MNYDIKTSYFSMYKEDNGISVARGMPKWFKGGQVIELCPSWKLIKDKSLSEQEWIEEYYNQVLSKLDSREIVEKVNNKVMLCWEKSGEFCHRRIVAEWIERETGIVVAEVGIEKLKRDVVENSERQLTFLEVEL